ncbi:hypothetical protein M427DRAFT_27330 [Gonapodya prolifera JEL478]|uniref:DOMON domain-containing protein n=1 Tax=Gonapodya prolifera (strain JEL478) TaxID=1344416 RepID=A0A139AYW6_GONPJ|nr:hypothetical protein M427DRAFT_27330 [Gonapodya prolifera JEL478]|eukprot:KXS21753.1 hypothetical protein M427DRAFT_27330 [Gonapodya prolifera JEL478]
MLSRCDSAGRQRDSGNFSKLKGAPVVRGRATLTQLGSVANAAKLCATGEPTFCCETTSGKDGDLSLRVTFQKTGLSLAAFGISPNGTMIGTEAYILWANTSSTNGTMTVSDHTQHSTLCRWRTARRTCCFSLEAATTLRRGQLVANLASVMRGMGDDNGNDFKGGNQTYAL